MVSSIYGIAVSGMNAAQAGVATTGHNIANANTAGYSRQQVVQSNALPQFTGAGYFGRGVNIDTVRRSYDQFLNAQVLQAQTQSSNLTTQSTLAQQVSNMLGDPNGGLTPALQDFFGAANAVANAPQSVASRQAMMNSAQTLVNRMQSLNQGLTDIRNGLNGQISNSVTLINSYAKQIATLNDNIVRALGSSSQLQPPNDLIDQRDQLIADLNKEVRATTVPQSDGSVSVFIGTGQSLVVGNKVSVLQATASLTDPTTLEVAYLNNGATIRMQQSNLQGGNLGAYLDFRQTVLDPAQNALGRIAMGLADTFNTQHQQGQDLNGALGGNFFKTAVPQVMPSSNNVGNGILTATVNSTTALTANDYKLIFDGTNYSVVNAVSNAVVQSITPAQLAAGQAVAGTGITLQLAAGSVAMASGDTFLIRPTVNGARDIGLAFTDPSLIAAASPVRSNATSTNGGTGVISAASVVPGLPLNANLLQPVTITFNNPPTTFSVAGVIAPAPAASYPYIPGGIALTNAAIAGGTNVTVASTAGLVAGAQLSGGGFPPGTTIASITNGTTFVASAAAVPAAATAQNIQVGNISFNGWTTTISGTPAAGATFTVAPNTNGKNDGSNILLLSALQTANTMENSTTSYQGAYGQLISQVGSQTRELSVTSQAQATMLTQVTNAQQSVSGVNLDEEAANLIKYQQAYQASAKSMQIANTMFDTLLTLGK